MAGALDDQVIYILSDESLNRLMHDEALIQSIKLTDNIEDKKEDWPDSVLLLLIAKIQSNYSNDDCIFFSFVLLVEH
jgi:hypothetical protein